MFNRDDSNGDSVKIVVFDLIREFQDAISWDTLRKHAMSRDTDDPDLVSSVFS